MTVKPITEAPDAASLTKDAPEPITRTVTTKIEGKGWPSVNDLLDVFGAVEHPDATVVREVALLGGTVKAKRSWRIVFEREVKIRG